MLSRRWALLVDNLGCSLGGGNRSQGRFLGASMDIAPPDDFNQLLSQRTSPADWINPKPAGRYNLVAIGGGTAGLISALGTAGRGGRAALIERENLGGDCLNYGCVPSKALLKAARAAYD